ncbi:MAG: PilZ domain-containing protein [Pseudanabaena sp. ELA607]|jgi:hypothetical protein
MEITAKQILVSLPSEADQRHHERVFADTGILVEVTMLSNRQEGCSFKGLVVDGSFSGCGIVAVTEQQIHLGQTSILHIENLGEVEAEVIWTERLASNLVRIGLIYRVS